MTTKSTGYDYANRVSLAVIAVHLLSITDAFAQDEDEEVATLIDSYASATRENAVAPRYPLNALRRGEEGWVMLSFIVTADGEIEAPMIEDSSGNEDFERAALKVLEKWDYKPATRNGTPVDQSLTKSKISFQIDGGTDGASRRFRREYREIQELILAGELSDVEDRIDNLRYTEKKNFYEDAWFWWLNYKYHNASDDNDTSEQISSLKKAIGYEESYLTPDILSYALYDLFVLQAQSSDYSGAAKSFETLQESKEAKRSEIYENVIQSLEPHYDQIEAMINGDTTLSMRARGGSNDYWVHDLIRRSFSLGEIDGQLEVVDVRCHRDTFQYSVSDTTVWTIPESWTGCGVYIKGTEGTTFTFFELPKDIE